MQSEKILNNFPNSIYSLRIYSHRVERCEITPLRHIIFLYNVYDRNECLRYIATVFRCLLIIIDSVKIDQCLLFVFR